MAASGDALRVSSVAKAYGATLALNRASLAVRAGAVKATYTSTVGTRRLPTMMESALAQRIRDDAHEYGATTGRPRDIAYIDPSNDFNFYIAAEPFSTTPARTTAFLMNASADSTMGSMIPYGMSETSVGVTSGGVNYVRTVTQVTVSPDNAPDYQVVTARGSNLTFNTLQNELVDVVRAISGIYVKAAGDNGSIIENVQQTLITAAAVLKGNRHIVVDETNSSGTAVKRIYVGNLTVSQTEQTLTRTKTAVALVNYNLQTASTDSLLNGLDTEIAYSRS